MKKGKILLLLCSLFLIFPFVIASCGGGGGGDSAPVTPAAPADPPAPNLSIDQNEYDFGTVTVGNTADLQVLVKNTGTADLNITSVELSGNDAFTINQNQSECGTAPYTIAAGSSCVLVLTFDPGAAGRLLAER